MPQRNCMPLTPNLSRFVTEKLKYDYYICYKINIVYYLAKINSEDKVIESRICRADDGCDKCPSNANPNRVKNM